MEYPNSGALWPNKNKKSESHPGLRGTIKIERSLLKELMANTDDELIEIEISSWTKEFKGEKFLSLKVAKPFKPGFKKQQDDDDNESIPF